MKETRPQVRLICSPSIAWGTMDELCTELGAQTWFDRMITREVQEDVETWTRTNASDAESLIEFAGRRCYRSYEPGLNPNITRVREDSHAYLRNILKEKHGSVLEHAQFTFDFHNVSRVFTHELVRHRSGVAISQESLRYVRLTDLGFRIPEVLANGPTMKQRCGERLDDYDDVPMRDAIVSIVERLEEFQRDAAEAFGLDDEGVPFAIKKEVTSALRRLAPIGLSTSMVWSANIRTLRHVIEMRTAPSAEEEIRLVFHEVGEIMVNECPSLFSDFHIEPVDGSKIPAWIPEWSKV